jgi:glycosyltransferase involved in cell wall biosynthesis
MNILMMTNTYVPHVGGVARSVAAFTSELRRFGHRVVVVAPEYGDDYDDKEDTIRIPAIQNFNGSDFAAIIPIPGLLEAHLKDFEPDIVHSNHPFLIGSTAVRVATRHSVPLVYTQHTMFEQYTHYVPLDLPKMNQFVVSLCTGYASLADKVIVPSNSIARVLLDRGVRTPIETVPTGVFLDEFAQGDGQTVRSSQGIPDEAFVVGHVGRLAPEKNLVFLSEAVSGLLRDEPDTHFLVVGYGSSEKEMREIFARHQVQDRVHFLGKKCGQELIDAYHAMDVFAFSSKSETQGLVLIEAMAAGMPAVALDATGVRDVLDDGTNGHLLAHEETETFSDVLKKIYHLPQDKRQSLVDGARQTAEEFSMHNCASKMALTYQQTLKESGAGARRDESVWQRSIDQIKTEWELFTSLAGAVEEALQNDGDSKS